MNLDYYLTLLKYISPELVVVATGLLVMAIDLIAPKNWSNQLVYLSLLGLAAAFYLDRWFVLPLLGLEGAAPAPPLLYLSPFASFVKDAVLVGTGLTVVLYQQQKGLMDFHPAEFLAILLFSASGMMFLISADDLIMVFLSMEFVGILAYILVGYMRHDAKAGEAAVKFYLIGAFSSAIMVYGMSFIYGLLGTTGISQMGAVMASHPEVSGGLLRMSVLLLLMGLGFKLAMVPFHTWLPDAMEGAPSSVAGFISVAPKAAGAAVVLRIFAEAFPLEQVQLAGILSVLAILTMSLGNLMAIAQRNIKRLLAYSSIGHIGYILVGVIASNDLGVEGILVYLLAYTFMNMGAFACVIAVSNRIGSDEIEDYAGLSQRNLPIALLLVLFLLSLGGIPPTAGFIGKWLVFGSAIKAAHATAAPWPYIWLAVIGVLNSVVSIYYYFRVAYQMFFRPPRERTGVEGSALLWVGAGFSAVMVLVIGIFPSQLIDVARAAGGLIKFLG